MPLQRFLLVEAKTRADGTPWLVTNPHSSKVYVGVERHPNPPAGDVDASVAAHFQPAPTVVADHPNLRRAAHLGRLSLHGEVVAKHHDAARQQLASKLPAPAPAAPASGAPPAAPLHPATSSSQAPNAPPPAGTPPRS